MNALIERIRQEPVLVTGLVTTICGLLVVFGVPLSSEQVGAILAFVGAVLALVIRRKTRSQRSLDLES